MNTLCLSSRTALARPSPTLSIMAKANAMKAEGLDVLSFAAGEPDFPTPEPICDAARAALAAGFTKYTPTSGIKELKEAIAGKLQNDNDVIVKPEQVVVSTGAKQSLYNATMMLVDAGDEVILIAPYWMTYFDQVRLAGGVPVVVKAEAENGFIPTREAIVEKVSPRTKAIVINSPNNPSGAVYSKQTLEEIAQIALRHGLWVICDEIYEKLVFGASHTSVASLGSEIAERTVTIGGCSKSFAMTGWRIGYAAAPIELAKTMAAFQDSVTSNPNSIAQRGALAALQMSPASVEKMRAEFEMRRDLIFDELTSIPGLDVPRPQGAFYVLPSVQEYLGGKVSTDMELSEHLLESALVATIPGSVFEASGHLRLSYTASTDTIRRGVSRIAEALSALRT